MSAAENTEFDGTAHRPALSGSSVGVRAAAPVFVVGSPRSGTTLLYHMLLSAGNFAIYRTESQVFNLMEPRFGDFSNARNFERMFSAWKRSRLFHETKLDLQEIVGALPSPCRNGGEFLRTVMERVARHQGVARWADCTPEHVLYLKRIKQTIPQALVVHVIRDGRDVALSMAKQAWIHPFPWDRGRDIEVAALYWEWVIEKGREMGTALGQDYMEVRFEQIVQRPQAALQAVGEFIGQPLDYEAIRKAGLGSVSQPNSSFVEPANAGFSPIARWKVSMPKQVLTNVQALTGQTLQSLNYALADCSEVPAKLPVRAFYRRYFDTKLFFKQRTSVGKLFSEQDLSWL